MVTLGFQLGDDGQRQHHFVPAERAERGWVGQHRRGVKQVGARTG
jgi:hypothetical protein